jgi:hypothetical protein
MVVVVVVVVMMMMMMKRYLEMRAWLSWHFVPYLH